jgi:hypothetical protein
MHLIGHLCFFLMRHMFGIVLCLLMGFMCVVHMFNVFSHEMHPYVLCFLKKLNI